MKTVEWIRQIPVSREWLEQLEAYLQADERFTKTGPDWWQNLALKTYDGKEVIFTFDDGLIR